MNTITNNGLNEHDNAKQIIEKFLNKKVKIILKVGNTKNSNKCLTYVGVINSVSKNLFCLKQDLGKDYSATSSFTINDFLINKVTISLENWFVK